MADVAWTVIASFFGNGLVAALLLCTGLAIGLWIGKRLARQVMAPHQLELQQLIGLLAPLVGWTRGLAEDMSQYRSVVRGVSDLFRGGPERLEEHQRLATASLLSQVVEANEQLQKRLDEAECRVRQQTSEMSVYMSEARTDALTGLPNRRAFDEVMTQRLAEWRRYRRPLSVIMVDVDHFKRFNDLYGHQAGDEVLCQVSRLLRATMRESDFVARFGGEEMAAILPGTDIREACRAARRARQAIAAARFEAQDGAWQVTVSLGAAQCMEIDTPAGLVKRADDALYAAKRAGRNRAFWHDGVQCLLVDGEALPECPASETGNRQAAEPCHHTATASFAEICQDLRKRVEQVALTTLPKN